MPRRKFHDAAIAKDLSRLAVGQTAFSAHSNWNFESGFTGWSKVDLTTTSLTGTIDTTVYHSGKQSLKLVNTATGEDDFYGNSVTIPSVPGAIWKVSAWCNVTSYTGPAISNSGLSIFDSIFTRNGQSTITAATSGWVFKSVTMTMPASAASLIVRLYAPQGTVYWDDVSIECLDPGTSGLHPAWNANTWATTSNLHINSAITTKAGDITQTKAAAANTLAGTSNLATPQAISTIGTPGRELVVDTFGRSNLVQNPDIELGNVNFGVNNTGTTVSSTTTSPHGGVNCLQIVCDGSTFNQGLGANNFYTLNGQQIAVGQTWTFSVWLKGSGTVFVVISERDQGNANLGDFNSSVVTLTGTWTRYTYTRTLAQTGVCRLGVKVITNVSQSITFFADDFQLERNSTASPDGAIVPGVADSNQAWILTGSWSITNNSLVCNDSTGGSAAQINNVSRNAEITAKILVPTAGQISLYGAAGVNSYVGSYQLIILAGGTWQIVRCINSSFAGLASGSGIVDGDVVGLRIVGTQITALKNGSVLSSVNDPVGIPNGVNVGVRQGGGTTGATLNNFRVVQL